MERSVFNLIKQNITRNPGRTIKQLNEIYRGRATQKDIRDAFYFIKGQKSGGEKINFSEFSEIVSTIRGRERLSRRAREQKRKGKVFKWEVRFDMWYIDIESGIEEYQSEVRTTVYSSEKDVLWAIDQKRQRIMERWKESKSLNSWDKLVLELREYKKIS